MKPGAWNRGASLCLVVCAAGVLGGSGCSKAVSGGTAPVAAAPAAAAAPAIPHNPLKEAYFGEQHIHTAYSLDAFLGGTRLTPFDAYEFAQGAEVEVNGVKHKLDRPLDWVAVTDHAEYIGEMYSTFTAGAPGHDQELLQNLRGMTDLKERQGWFM